MMVHPGQQEDRQRVIGIARLEDDTHAGTAAFICSLNTVDGSSALEQAWWLPYVMEAATMCNGGCHLLALLGPAAASAVEVGEGVVSPLGDHAARDNGNSRCQRCQCELHLVARTQPRAMPHADFAVCLPGFSVARVAFWLHFGRSNRGAGRIFSTF